MHVKKYTHRERMIFGWFVFPYAIIISLLMFGTSLFKTWQGMLGILVSTILFFGIVYSLFDFCALLIKRRFPEHKSMFKRIAIMLPVFYVMNILMIQGLYYFMELTTPGGEEPDRSMEWWATAFGCVCSTVLTFINEALTGWDTWKIAVRETEKLKYAYQKTKLLGLKGQVNPHFLFNCFNTLSSLISEDGDAAEKFLDEMTKVHRYMLRNDDEHMTSLREELNFAKSYLYLIQARFGNAVQTEIDPNCNTENLMLPPLSLQVILENIVYNNSTSRDNPLKISMFCRNQELSIKHTVNPRKGVVKNDEEEGLDNLIKKYELLNNARVSIIESDNQRQILLPLIEGKEDYYDV